MTTSQARPLLSPEEIAVRAGEQVQFLRLPEAAEVFAAREIRLHERASGHPMHEFLAFAGVLAHAQHDALKSFPHVALPDQPALKSAAELGQPPLPAALWPRDAKWIAVLREMTRAVLDKLDTQHPTRTVLDELLVTPNDEVEQQADRLLNNIMFGLDLAKAPLIAAALQVYWTHLVLATEKANLGQPVAPFGRVTDATRCPCCGSLPTASISRSDPGGGTYRYLHCSLCSSQWHVVRIKCSHCESTKGIHYHSLQAAEDESETANKAPIEVETCDECHHYLKIVRMERNPQVEPAADDLASLTLDLLVSDAGYQRHGVNLMLLFGDPETDPSGSPVN